MGDIRLPRCQASLVAVGGDLYLCGGATRTHGTDFTTAASLRDIDKYSKKFDMWEKVAELDTERHACGGAAVGKIHTIYLLTRFVTGQLKKKSNFFLLKLEQYTDA